METISSSSSHQSAGRSGAVPLCAAAALEKASAAKTKVAKAAGVPEAVRKASAKAKKNLVEVPLEDGTIPHEIVAKFGASKILLKPAAPGTGLIVGSAARAVLELAGVKDVLGKSFGGPSRINLARATIVALANLRRKEATKLQGDAEAKEAKK